MIFMVLFKAFGWVYDDVMTVLFGKQQPFRNDKNIVIRIDDTIKYLK